MSQVGILSGNVAQDSPLRRWRQEHGFTQAQVATACGVKISAVSRWEQGRRKPFDEALLRLMELTHIPAEALMFPVRCLEQHPTYLGAWASTSPGRGRPRQHPPAEEGGAC